LKFTISRQNNEIKSPRGPEGVPGLLRDLVHDRTGIYFEDSRIDLLMEKLEPLARERGHQSFLDYYYALKDNQSLEWERAWEVLSVQETYFWREMSQIEALTRIIIPDWFQKHTTPFRIWCAACATGEEPYSIAIALAEAGLGALPVEIIASDASPMALKKAGLAVYRERSFRSLPLELRQKYFKPVNEGWKLDAKITSRIKFRPANLAESADVAALARVNVIFCRNVFIYFSAHAVRQTVANMTVANMAAKMPEGGYLFVGAAESLLRMTSDFDLQEVENAFAYRRIR
jgi:chemotaxis protein methyltransferase CheR